MFTHYGFIALCFANRPIMNLVALGDWLCKATGSGHYALLMDQPCSSITRVGSDDWLCKAMFTHYGFIALCFANRPIMNFYGSWWHQMIGYVRLCSHTTGLWHYVLLMDQSCTSITRVGSDDWLCKAMFTHYRFIALCFANRPIMNFYGSWWH